MIDFPSGWGARINLTASQAGPVVYQPEPLLDLLPTGTRWAHWSPRNLGHTSAGWMPVASMLGGVIHPVDMFAGVEDGALFLVGNDQEQNAIRNGTGTVKEAARRHANQLSIIRQWANDADKEYGWAAPQWNVNQENLDLLGDWVHEMRQHHGYPRPHRLAIHLYGAWNAESFWAIVDEFEAWREERLPGVRVVVSEFSGWPGSSPERQMAVMDAGREYLNRDYVDWVAWFSGYPFVMDSGAAWGTELATVDDAGTVTLTPLGEYWRTLA